MSFHYVDTSAALKLLIEEEHSTAFASFYDGSPDASWVSSALLRVEVMRAVARVLPAALPDARDLLTAFDIVTIDGDVIDMAMNEPDWRLRSLDAIHLATARLLVPDLDCLVTYDDQLASAARDSGLMVVTPRG